MKLLCLTLIAFVLFSCSEDKESEKSSSAYNGEKTEKLIVKDTTVIISDGDVELNFALLSPETNDPSLDSLIYVHASFYAVTQTDIAQIKEEWNGMQNGLVSTVYNVNYNQNGIFDMSYDLEYLGAHLSYDYENISLDLYDRKPIKLSSLIDPDKMKDFLTACNEKLQVNLNDAQADIPEEDVEEMTEYFKGHEVVQETLEEYSLRKDGIVVYYDAFFPHYAKAYEPSSVLLFSYEEVSEFLDKSNAIVQRLLDSKTVS